MDENQDKSPLKGHEILFSAFYLIEKVAALKKIDTHLKTGIFIKIFQKICFKSTKDE
jgi:hypothetical protein